MEILGYIILACGAFLAGLLLRNNTHYQRGYKAGKADATTQISTSVRGLAWQIADSKKPRLPK